MKANEKLYGLDINEFLKPQYAEVGRYGAGAVGIITPSQMVNVWNTNNGEGLHIDTKDKIIKSIYKKIDSDKETETILKSIITLEYTNQKYGREYMRRVIIHIPDYITEYQYETLCCLALEFEELKEYGFWTYVVANNIHVQEHTSSNRPQNYLIKILSQLSNRIKDTSTFPMEQLGTFGIDNTLTTMNTIKAL